MKDFENFFNILVKDYNKDISDLNKEKVNNVAEEVIKENNFTSHSGKISRYGILSLFVKKLKDKKELQVIY